MVVAGEPRTRNYLKDATRASIAAGQVLRYRLQWQLRLPPPDAQIQADCLSSAVPWDETVFPWRDLAEVELDESLSYQESMLTWFDPGNHPATRPPGQPASLPVPKARSIDDPHSLNHLRLAAIWANRARLLSCRLSGMPAAFGDSRKDSDWQGLPPLQNPP